MEGGNVKLKEMASALQDSYGPDSVYRYGGDEFLVSLGERAPFIASEPLHPIRWAIVQVEVERNRPPRDFAETAVLFHLNKGFAYATEAGLSLEYAGP